MQATSTRDDRVSFTLFRFFVRLDQSGPVSSSVRWTAGSRPALPGLPWTPQAVGWILLTFSARAPAYGICMGRSGSAGSIYLFWRLFFLGVLYELGPQRTGCPGAADRNTSGARSPRCGRHQSRLFIGGTTGQAGNSLRDLRNRGSTFYLLSSAAAPPSGLQARVDGLAKPRGARRIAPMRGKHRKER